MRGGIKKQSDFYLISSGGELGENLAKYAGFSKNASGKKAFEGIKDDKLEAWQNTLAKNRGQNLADIFSSFSSPRPLTPSFLTSIFSPTVLESCVLKQVLGVDSHFFV